MDHRKKSAKADVHFLLVLIPKTQENGKIGTGMTQILNRKKIKNYLEDKICQDFGKCPKKVEGGLSKR